MLQVGKWKETSKFALRYPTFRLYFAGSFPSRIGEWMDFVAINWAVLQLTHSPIHLGMVNACRLVPIFLCSLPGGMLADRYDRRKLLIYVHLGMMVFTFVLAALFHYGSPLVWIMMTVAFRAIFMAMETSIRNAYIPNLIPPSSISSAIAIHTSGIHIGRILGPAAAGWLLTVGGCSFIIAIYGLTLAITLFSLCSLEKGVSPAQKSKRISLDGMKEALIYIKNAPIVQSLLVLAIVPMVFGFPYSSVIPLFVKELMKMGPDGFGALLSISSIGALLSTVWLSVWTYQQLGKWLICFTLGFGVSLIGFIFTAHHILLASLFMFFVGLTSQVYRTLSRAALQTNIPDDVRGRIMSIALMDRGMIPVGTIIITAIADWIGVFGAGIVMGAGCICCTLLVLLHRKHLWRI
jgi:MFS transporter, DHA1 family, staphyloferrin A biosynthesis exporter